MEEFAHLRKLAAKKRDTAIAAARADYKQAVARITDLKRSLGGKSRKAAKSPLRPMCDLLYEVLPRDRLFTIDEAYELLQQTQPGRYFHLPTVRGEFTDLNRRGVIRRVRRGSGPRVLWAHADFHQPATEFGARNLLSVAQQVLRERGPMRAIELVVYLQSRGYRPDTDPRVLTRSATETMRRNPETFTCGADRRWAVGAE
jgi:hypothetical protein